MKVLETERLRLTPWRLEDAQDLYDYAKHPEVGPPAGWAPHKNVEESKEIIETIFLPSGAWAIREKVNGKAIGSIGLEFDKHRPETASKEMGYSLGYEYWGKGYMTEAAKEVIRYGFEELGLDIIGICTSDFNKRSQSVIKKCGFKYDGTIRMTYKTALDGTIRDSMCFSLLKTEWEEMKK